MAFVPKYSHFKVVTMTKDNDSLMETEVIDNLKYKEALKRFKEYRLSIKSDNIVLKMIGITSTGECIDRLLVDFSDNDSVAIKKSSNINKGSNSECRGGDKDKKEATFTEEPSLNKEVILASILKSRTKHKQHHYNDEGIDNTLNDNIMAESISDTVLKDDMIEYECNTPSSSKLDDGSTNGEYKEIDDFDINSEPCIDEGVENSLLSNIKDYYGESQRIDFKEIYFWMHENLHNIRVNDIIDMVTSALYLLWEKNLHLSELLGLYDKEVSVSVHKLEEIPLMGLDCDDEIKYLVEVGKKISSTTKKRRDTKTDIVRASRLIQMLNIEETMKHDRLHKFYWNPKQHKIGDGNGTSIFEYRYSSEDEKKTLLDSLIYKYDKVIIEEDGLIKCYNLVKKDSSKKETQRKTTPKISICHDEDSVGIEEMYKDINFIGIRAGQCMPGDKKASIRVSEANLGWVSYYSKLKDRKYKEMIFNNNTQELFMISV